LYKISIASNKGGTFRQLTKLRDYNFCFANISNIQIFAEPKPEAAMLPVLTNETVVYPNPSHGIFNFKKNNAAITLNRINIYNPMGEKVADVANTSSIDLSALPAGVYIYSAQKENDIIKGRLIKN
jgi:hypothetical protein